jgi:hypothetical protein
MLRVKAGRSFAVCKFFPPLGFTKPFPTVFLINFSSVTAQ